MEIKYIVNLIAVSLVGMPGETKRLKSGSFPPNVHSWQNVLRRHNFSHYY